MNNKEEVRYSVEFSGGGPVTIVDEFDYSDQTWAVVSDDECLKVHRKSELIPYEESNEYKYDQERAAQIARYKAAEDTITQRIQKKALEQLDARIRLNVAFGPGGQSNYALLTVADELQKMIEKFDTRDLQKEMPQTEEHARDQQE